MSVRLILWALCLASLGLAASNEHTAPRQEYLHPDIQIAGIPKAGTSQMYQLLKNHEDTVALRKEWCPNDGDLLKYSKDISDAILELRAGSKGDVKSVSACINTKMSLEYFRWVKEHGMPLQNTPKFIFLMRDPADWLWARFNFWTTNADVFHNLPTRWTTEQSYRSPEYFQITMEAEGRLVGSINLTQTFFQEQYKLDALEQLMEAAGRENVMVINSGDLEEPDGAFIERFTKFTGLSVDGFNETVLHGRTNSGSSLNTRGMSNIMETPQVAAGVYEISGYRPMLPKSRAFIYEHARSFCQELAAKYGIYFSRCLNSPSVAEEQHQQQLKRLRGGHDLHLGHTPRMVHPHGITPRRPGEHYEQHMDNARHFTFSEQQ